MSVASSNRILPSARYRFRHRRNEVELPRV